MAFNPKVTFSNIAQAVSKTVNKACSKIGTALERSPRRDKFEKFINSVDPTGGNNTFLVMMALMVLGVVVPRLLTALKRNPDDKEATMDEITEISFRDIQSVIIILFALKSMNTMIANKATKVTGLPMTNKPYKALFETKEKGFKGITEKAKEFGSNPIQKLKTIGRNIIDTIHPTKGSMAYTNDEFTAKYSNYNSINEIVKMFDGIEPQGGNSQKIFDKTLDSLIKEQETLINGNKKKGFIGLISKAGKTANKDGSFNKLSQDELVNAHNLLSELKGLKGKNYKTLQEDSVSDSAKNVIISFFQDKNNPLLNSAKKLNAGLRTGALAFEATYLGFGLPWLNEKRLERKYLSKNPQSASEPENNIDDTFVNNAIKNDKNKAFQKFMANA